MGKKERGKWKRRIKKTRNLSWCSRDARKPIAVFDGSSVFCRFFTGFNDAAVAVIDCRLIVSGESVDASLWTHSIAFCFTGTVLLLLYSSVDGREAMLSLAVLFLRLCSLPALSIDESTTVTHDCGANRRSTTVVRCWWRLANFRAAMSSITERRHRRAAASKRWCGEQPGPRCRLCNRCAELSFSQS